METLNNLGAAASKAVWGDKTAQSGEEPPSGQTGAGTATDPYDAGNAPEQPGSTTSPDTSTSTTATDVDASKPTSTSTNPEPLPKSEDVATTGTSTIGGKTDTSNLPTKPETASSNNPTSGTENTATQSVGDPASVPVPQAKQQGADRPTEEPSDEQTAAISSKKSAAEDSLQKNDEPEETQQEFKHDPNDHSGEPLGSVKHDESKKASGDDDGPKLDDKPSEEEGTGEKYVKSSGMAADGGDFDVTKPGAGREADRLLEEKGIHHTFDPKDNKKTADSSEDVSPSGGAAPTTTTANPETGKHGKLDKIKEKLHIGKH